MLREIEDLEERDEVPEMAGISRKCFFFKYMFSKCLHNFRIFLRKSYALCEEREREREPFRNVSVSKLRKELIFRQEFLNELGQMLL